MISIPCPRCQAEFKAGQRDEDAIGTLRYHAFRDDVEPDTDRCTDGHVLSGVEWVEADTVAWRAYIDAKGQYDGPDTLAEKYNR